MAISSPRLPLPSVSPLSTFFSQERRRRGGFQLRASLDSMFPSNHDPEIKRQNHIREKLSNTKFSVDSGANQPIEADVEVPIDERSKKHSVISREIDGFGFSEGGIEKEGAKQAALRMRNEEKSNSQILVSQEVESSQIQSEIGESSRTIGMVSEEMHQLEGFVREEEGTDPFRAPTFGLAVKTEAQPAGRVQMHSAPREETDDNLNSVTCLNSEEQNKNNHQNHDSSTNQSTESKISFSKGAHLNGNSEITGEEPWWYRLPCVLGILLSGGESEGAPEGLYSLEIKPKSTDRNPMSYAITFQDRVDATNFCYVLDLFFEDLNDVSAEIVPLTIQEIKEEVQSGGLNIIVIPKGKLKLYGGQTLEEVEIELRSFVS